VYPQPRQGIGERRKRGRDFWEVFQIFFGYNPRSKGLVGSGVWYGSKLGSGQSGKGEKETLIESDLLLPENGHIAERLGFIQDQRKAQRSRERG